MKARLPLWPTLLVGAAMAVMIALGIWQLGRKAEKEALIARYAAAAGQPETAWPAVPPADDSLLYRRAAGFCLRVTGWRAVAGRNRAGDSGWSHIAQCSTGGMEGPGMQVDAGWSRSDKAPAWSGGAVAGIVAPDARHRIRLVAATPVAGLEPSAAPTPDAMSNNHLLYALQWFFFAAAAGLIYLLALRRRQAAPAKPRGVDLSKR